MSSINTIQAIAFDAYGTLFNVASIDARLIHHFGDKAAEIGPLWRRKQLEYTWLRTLMGKYKDFYALTEDALAFACIHTNIEASEAIVADLMDHYNRLSIYPEVLAGLEALSQHFKLAILSNANPELLEKAVAHNQIGHTLSTVLSVHPLRQFKPVPSVYQLAVSHWRASKENILFVSSNTWDVAGAKSFGLQVAWIKRKQGQLEQLGFTPDLEVDNLKDLASKLIG